MNSIDMLVSVDAHKTVGMCEAIMKSDHDTIISRLVETPLMQYKYIKKLIKIKHEQIKHCIRSYVINKKLSLKDEALQWQKILSIHMRLTSKIEPELVVDLVRSVAEKEGCYPLEECL